MFEFLPLPPPRDPSCFFFPFLSHESSSSSFLSIRIAFPRRRSTQDSRGGGGEAKLEIKLFSPPPLSLSLSLLFFLFDLEKIAFGLSAHVFVSQDRKKGGYRRGDGNLLLFLFAKKKRQILDQVCDAIRGEEEEEEGAIVRRALLLLSFFFREVS